MLNRGLQPQPGTGRQNHGAGFWSAGESVAVDQRLASEAETPEIGLEEPTIGFRDAKGEHLGGTDAGRRDGASLVQKGSRGWDRWTKKRKTTARTTADRIADKLSPRQSERERSTEETNAVEKKAQDCWKRAKKEVKNGAVGQLWPLTN